MMKGITELVQASIRPVEERAMMKSTTELVQARSHPVQVWAMMNTHRRVLGAETRHLVGQQITRHLLG
jgi:hypothetical protein